ncbi:serine/threonine protein kinase [Streptomyces sp. P1-3]|uniref:serine/threonine protein kinase n=1 Tax=Streptomyces sp. P1-3 TaxID=3421658 RepID=UPI003D36B524
MGGLLIEPTGMPGPSPGPFEVRCDQEVTFGRGAADGAGVDGEPVDIPLEDPAAEPLAGRIRATADYWLITNLSRVSSYVVDNDDDRGEYVRVPPGRVNMPIPFTHARVTLPSLSGRPSLTVTAPRPAYVDIYTAPPPLPVDQAMDAFALDEAAKYFLVLVALCEPRLRDASTPAIPNTPEIVRRLSGVGSWGGITRAAVNFHIEYLARHKLRVRDKQAPGTGERVNWQREAVVATALRFGLVRKEHLDLLDPP